MHMPIIIAEIKLKLPPTNQIKLGMLVRKGYKNKHEILTDTAGWDDSVDSRLIRNISIWFKSSYAIFMFTGIHVMDTKKFYELRGFYQALEIFPIIK